MPEAAQEGIMRLEWFENPDNVVYVEREKFVDNFAKETGIPKLGEEIESFELRPEREGRVVKGTRRTSVRLMIPNITFGSDIEMGDNVWLYIGEQYPAYCIYDGAEK